MSQKQHFSNNLLHYSKRIYHKGSRIFRYNCKNMARKGASHTNNIIRISQLTCIFTYSFHENISGHRFPPKSFIKIQHPIYSYQKQKRGKFTKRRQKQYLALNIGAIKCEPCINFHATIIITKGKLHAVYFLMDIIFIHYFVPNSKPQRWTNIH